MTTIDKLLGTNGCILVSGASATPMPTGFGAYAAEIRVDSTEFASITWISGGSTITGVTGLTWEGKGLLRGDYVPFAYPVTSITLTNGADSVFAYLETL